uniref:Uncharacterized protein n=1 Tax=Glossina pallidipes TaxID=7398 RepID=A0A1A9ZBV2_GLOPL
MTGTATDLRRTTTGEQEEVLRSASLQNKSPDYKNYPITALYASTTLLLRHLLHLLHNQGGGKEVTHNPPCRNTRANVCNLKATVEMSSLQESTEALMEKCLQIFQREYNYLPDAKDLHNMSLVGSYGSHLLHSFHPHLLQTLNHNMLANGSAAAASYFASERAGLTKPSVLTNFQLPSAFSPPKYIGISLDQNLFNGNDSFRTDSASPTCTSHESLEGSNDYDGEKGESPRSNASDPRDLRRKFTSDDDEDEDDNDNNNNNNDDYDGDDDVCDDNDNYMCNGKYADKSDFQPENWLKAYEYTGDTLQRDLQNFFHGFVYNPISVPLLRRAQSTARIRGKVQTLNIFCASLHVKNCSIPVDRACTRYRVLRSETRRNCNAKVLQRFLQEMQMH